MWLGIREPGALPRNESRGFVTAWLWFMTAGVGAATGNAIVIGGVLLALLPSIGEFAGSSAGCD